jgi:hypothetical protein
MVGVAVNARCHVQSLRLRQHSVPEAWLLGYGPHPSAVPLARMPIVAAAQAMPHCRWAAQAAGDFHIHRCPPPYQAPSGTERKATETQNNYDQSIVQGCTGTPC